LGDELLFRVLDEESLKKDEKIGEGATKLSALILNGGIDEWF
jgi:hypothetical protein